MGFELPPKIEPSFGTEEDGWSDPDLILPPKMEPDPGKLLTVTFDTELTALLSDFSNPRPTFL